MAAWAQLGKVAWELAKKYWPLALEAWRQVDKFTKDHPGIPDALRRRIEAVRERFAEAQRKRTPEARVRATLDVIRRIADERSEDEAIAPDSVADLRHRVEAIQRALALAEARTGEARRTMLSQVVKRTDALAAEVFMTLIPDDLPESDAEASSGEATEVSEETED